MLPCLTIFDFFFNKFPSQMSLNAMVALLSASSATRRLSKTWVERTWCEAIIQHNSNVFNLPLQDITSLEKTHTTHYRWKRQHFIPGLVVHSITTPGDQGHCPLPSIARGKNGHFPPPALALQVGITLTSNAGSYAKPNTERKTWSSQPPRALCISSWPRW